MSKIRGKTAIVGIGEVPTGHYPNRSFIKAATVASIMAIKDAGIDKSLIDTIIPSSCLSGYATVPLSGRGGDPVS